MEVCEELGRFRWGEWEKMNGVGVGEGGSAHKRLRPLRQTKAEGQPRQNRGAGQNMLRAFPFALKVMLHFGHINNLDG